jgi:hypothetical protein
VSVKNGKPKLKLDPNAPGLDEETRQRRRSLAKMQQMSPKELLDLAVRAGIYTKKGHLTKHYRPTEANVSKYRPTD